MPRTKRILLLLIFALIFHQGIFAWTDEEIANSIFKAEGGFKATYLYGIRSVHYQDEADARRICLNTIRNNRARFAKQSAYTDYLEFLSSRYCPASAHQLNKYWLKNVRYFLKQENK